MHICQTDKTNSMMLIAKWKSQVVLLQPAAEIQTLGQSLITKLLSPLFLSGWLIFVILTC